MFTESKYDTRVIWAYVPEWHGLVLNIRLSLWASDLLSWKKCKICIAEEIENWEHLCFPRIILAVMTFCVVEDLFLEAASAESFDTCIACIRRNGAKMSHE